MSAQRSYAGDAIRATGSDAVAQGAVTLMHLADVGMYMRQTFADEPDRKELALRCAAIVERETDTAPSAFAQVCNEIAEVVDEVSARWEAEIQTGETAT